MSELSLKKIVRASTNVLPMVCFVYERWPYYATVSQLRDLKLADPKALGVPLDLDGDAARVTFVGDTTVLSFVRGGVAVTVFTNLPPSLAVRFARSLGAK